MSAFWRVSFKLRVNQDFNLRDVLKVHKKQNIMLLDTKCFEFIENRGHLQTESLQEQRNLCE